MTERPTVTQAMVDLYDRYTHVTLDRRDLIAGLTRLAGSSTATLALLPLLEANQAKAAIVRANDPRIKAETISWPGAAGQTMRGYLVRPAKATKPPPAVMVIHENRGLNEHIRDIARRIALENYVALAPDFLSPAGGTPADEDAARAAIGNLDMKQTIANAVATVEYLRQNKLTTGRVGTIGFCWGGGLVNQTAIHAGTDLAAGVSYYGPAPNPTDATKIKAPMLLHYAGLDERINAGVPAYEAALQAAKVPYTAHVYPGVNHAFNNDTSAARYDKAAAELAWNRTLAFLDEHLRQCGG